MRRWLTYEEFVDGYGYGKPPLLVTRLRACALSDASVRAAVEAVANTCQHCWDADISERRCCCMMDD